MTDYVFHRDRSLPLPATEAVFVFGSNLKGWHGKGAALVAQEKFGAVYGKSVGPMGQCYAIPTKATPWQTLPLFEIRASVEVFKQYANARPKQTFFVTRIGCGEAGYRDDRIAPLFRQSPANCSFAEEWRQFLGPWRLATLI